MGRKNQVLHSKQLVNFGQIMKSQGNPMKNRIGDILLEHPKKNSAESTMSKLYQTHKKFGAINEFQVNRRLYRRLL